MFDDIRPYRDNEVSDVLDRLLNEQELMDAIARFNLPTLHKFLPSLASWFVKRYLSQKTSRFETVDQIQIEVAKYLSKLIKQSTHGFSYSGIEQLDFSKPTLFISNHRDIVLDVAFVNLALHRSGGRTVEAAVGDNLLHKSWVADLMRINKSFIVKRNEETKRKMLAASKQLSAYIHHSLTENHQNIWIAQKEGRAKDGVDKTNAALISMLLLNKPKDVSISEYIEQLNIVPVSISYEYDPCDRDKAIELTQIEETGDYEKAEDEDFNSITQGMIGQKGKVHVAFGRPLAGDFEDSKSIAAAIDKQIIANYQLQETNTSAFNALQGDKNALCHYLKAQINSLKEAEQQKLLTMYANPVIAKSAS